MENHEGIESLFFELASESRLNILREINKQDGKMREIARKLDLTTTETFRQLHRLNEGLLVRKQPEGSYSITEYGKFVLQLCLSFEFIFKHKEYFSTHEFQRLPYQFLNRIGEVSNASLKTDTIENINTAQRITREAEQYMWGGGAEQPLDIGSAVQENLSKGVKYKWLFPERFIPKQPLPLEISRVVEWRSLENIPVNFVITEKEAGITFCFVGGKVDYAGFIGKDAMFLRWVTDLFLYYWDKGQKYLH